MHTNKTYSFQTLEQAKEFAKDQNYNVPVNEDRYVTGPVYIDEDEIFKNMKTLSKGRKYWNVHVERYL